MKITSILLRKYILIAVVCYFTIRIGMIFLIPHYTTHTLPWKLVALFGDMVLVAYISSFVMKITRRLEAIKHQMSMRSEELRLKVEQYELAWTGLGDGLWDWDIKNDTVFYSDRFLELLGYAPHEIPPRYDEWKQRLHPSDKGYVLTALQSHLDEKSPFNIEYRLRVKSGEWQWFKARGQAIWNDKGKAIRMCGGITDIADHKFAENIRDRLIKKLVAANEQSEQFAYITSHNLHEPLRVIVSLTDLMINKYSDRLDDEGRSYLSMTCQAAKKMEMMISDLLEYGWLGEHIERATPVDCNSIIRDALDNIQESIQATQAIVNQSTLPTVMGNSLRLTRLFQNLISNALSYQCAGNLPIIHISAEDKGGFWQFAVADNGRGIQKEHLESIFIPYNRINCNQEQDGTGIDLAMCKRIVESFSGSIWVKSVEGNGSTFYFTIPKYDVGATPT